MSNSKTKSGSIVTTPTTNSTRLTNNGGTEIRNGSGSKDNSKLSNIFKK